MTALLLKLFVKGDDSNREQYGKLSGITGIACNLILFLIKLLAGVLSGSISIIADAFNNFSDMGTSVITILGFKLSSKPADKEHPYGHGRIEYMSGFIVSAAIVVVGIELFKSAFEKLIDPSDLDVTVLTIVILASSIIVKLWLYFFNRKVGRLIGSSAIVATAKDSLNDSVATTAVLISSLLFKFSGVNIDAYAGLLVAGFIIFGGITSAKETISPLLGEPPSREFVDKLKQRILENEMFTGVHDLIVHNYGPGRTFASIHIEVPADIDILKCHEAIDLCEKVVGDEFGILLVAHMDPVECGEEVSDLKVSAQNALEKIDPRLTLHDFRVVRGENVSNLIFDVVVPYEFFIPHDELKNRISYEVSAVCPMCVCVINFDNDYV